MNKPRVFPIWLSLAMALLLEISNVGSGNQGTPGRPTISGNITLAKNEYPPGGLISGTAEVSVQGLRRSLELHVYAICSEDPQLVGDLIRVIRPVPIAWPLGRFLGRMHFWHQDTPFVQREIQSDGTIRFRLETDFPIRVPEVNGPLQYAIRVWVMTPRPDDSLIAVATLPVATVMVTQPKKEIVLFNHGIKGSQPVPRRQKVYYNLKYKITGLPRDPNEKVNLLERAELYREEKTPDGKTTLVKLNVKDKMYGIQGVSGGEVTCERQWWVNVQKGGRHLLKYRVDIGGFAPLEKEVWFTAQEDRADVPTPQADEYVWACDGPVDNFAQVSGQVPGLYAGATVTSLTVNEEYIKDGKPQKLATTVSWTAPPLVLQEGQKLTITLNAPQREGSLVTVGEWSDNYYAWVKEGSFKCSAPSRYTSTNAQNWPHGGTTTMEYEVKVGRSLGSKFTLQMAGAKWMMPAYKVDWVYTLKRAGDVKPAEEGPDGGAVLEPAETFNLTAWLESETLELVLGEISKVCTVYFKGWRPQGNRVEALIATSDAFGSTAVNRDIQVAPGTTSAETFNIIAGSSGEGGFAEMWSARSTAQAGTWQVPIIVRQDGVGQVRLLQNIRIVPKRGAVSPPTGPTGPAIPEASSQQGLSARLEYPAITLWPGQVSEVCGIYVRGWDSRDGPVSVVFPQSDGGILPGGILVFPGNTGAFPYNMTEGPYMGVRGYYRFAQMFRAREDAPPGITMVDVIVRQENMGEARLRLQVNVKAPGVPAGPALTAGPTLQPVSNGISPQGMTARLDCERIYLRPGGTGSVCNVNVKGFLTNVPDEVEVVFPQADRLGVTPFGLHIFPGTSSDAPTNLLGRRSPQTQDSSFQEIYRAREDAQSGSWPVDILVRQRGAGEVRLRLVVVILDKLRPDVQERPGRDPLAYRPPDRVDAGRDATATVEDAEKVEERLTNVTRLIILGKDEEALVEATEIISQNPANARAWEKYGDVMVFKKNWAIAAEAFMTATVLEPTNPQFRLSLARSLLRQGKKEEAKAEARQVLRGFLPESLRAGILKEFELVE